MGAENDGAPRSIEFKAVKVYVQRLRQSGAGIFAAEIGCSP